MRKIVITSTALMEVVEDNDESVLAVAKRILPFMVILEDYDYLIPGMHQVAHNTCQN